MLAVALIGKCTRDSCLICKGIDVKSQVVVGEQKTGFDIWVACYVSQILQISPGGHTVQRSPILHPCPDAVSEVIEVFSISTL